MVKIVEDIFGVAINPLTNMAEVVRRYTMSNSSRLSVSIIQLGATVQSIRTPDAYHNMEDICLGFDDVAGYVANHQHLMGCTLGRVVGHVTNGEFIMDERRVEVSRNHKSKHQLNGGFIGFDRIIWQLHAYRPDGITLRHISKAGHEGYPGNLAVMITYTMDDDNRLFMRIEASTDHVTAVNICNHLYFNLAGHKSGTPGMFQHRITINADDYIETDDEGLPTGRFLPVENTVNDVRLPTLMGDRLRQLENLTPPGYNVCFAVHKDFDANMTRLAARFLHPECGRYLEVHTNQPAIHLTTANLFPDATRGEEPIMGKQCTRYWQHCAFSLRVQKYPDSMNHLDFPTIFIMPGENYFHETILRFGVQESWLCCAGPDEATELNWNSATLAKKAVI